MTTRSKFPPVFWVANLIEVLERFAYYGIYFGFGIYMASLGFKREDLGIVQSLFLLVSYTVPVVSGTFADRYGFKKILIVSYFAYLPSILLLLYAKTLPAIAVTMLLIGMAAGIFKPLISGSVRVTSDATNKTLGFGIFYAMVNIGGSFGPIVAGKLRAISWSYAFVAAATAIGVMLLVTLLFFKEPPREATGETLGDRLRGIGTALGDARFAIFLILLGVLQPLRPVRRPQHRHGAPGRGHERRPRDLVHGVLHPRRRAGHDARPGRDDLAHGLVHHAPAARGVAGGGEVPPDAVVHGGI